MGSLCEICRTIPFREIQANPGLKVKKIELGDCDDVKQRQSCPFCCLALQSIQDAGRRLGCSDAREYLQKYGVDTSIEVSWRPQDHIFETYGMPLRYTAGASPSLARIVKSKPLCMGPITSSLADCESCHECSLDISDEEMDRLFLLRAIDVNQMSITSILPTTKYVALSYVWGGIPAPNLLQSNKEEFMRPGGLEAHQDKIPATIRDAIVLVRKMNLQYLWVDAMCLVQDDREDMMVGINAMSIIYEHSYFTIIAADGLNANAGLPGICQRKVIQVAAEILPGLSLVGIPPIGDLLEISYYSKRAWTFQEFHLSRRKLIFHNNMVYYQCLKGSWSEDIEGQPIESRIRQRALVPTRVNKLLFEFRLIIDEYALRNAFFEHDIVNALASVYYKMLGREYEAHLFGIPIAVFDSFLCFYAKETNMRFLERRQGLPSWAWSGWRGSFDWASKSDDDDELRWNADCTWIIWYIRNSSGSLSPIWDLPTKRGRNGSTTSTEQLHGKRVAKIQGFSADTLPTVPSRFVPDTFHWKYSPLQFWSFSAFFRIRVDTEGENYVNSLRFMDCKVVQRVFGLDEKYFGFVQVDKESSKCDHDNAELIVISESAGLHSHDYAAFYRNKYDAKAETHPNGYWYNVLYVEEKLGIAERRGFGQVNCEAIQVSPESRWKWKEVILG
ncbi:HET-domain-containing protein [Xylaria palmicola]|nr:HET-domain-containing protein [Xylaria palmicola]